MKKLKLNKKTKADALLIAFCLALSAALYLWYVLGSEDGIRAVVRINGDTVATYPLAVDGTYSLNGGTNVLVIENGGARMEEASCPDHICVKQGIISRSGQCISCLPNRVSVSVEGGTPEVDTVVG